MTITTLDGGTVMAVPDPPVPLVAVINPDGTTTISHQTLATATPGILDSILDANGKLFGFEPLHVGIAAAVAAYFLLGKK